jgi:hypothetical protein
MRRLRTAGSRNLLQTHAPAHGPVLRCVSGLSVQDAEFASPAALDVFAAHGVDVARVRRMYPHALQYEPARILETIAALKSLSVDFVKVLNRWPALWRVDPRCWEERVAVLRDMGVDVARVLTGCPAVLGFPPDTLRAKGTALSRMGLKAAHVVKLCPTVFGFSDDRIRHTLAFLDGVGLDGVRLANAFPAVLGFSVDTKLRPVVHFVTLTMGRAVTELQNCPACFGYSLKGRLVPRYAFAVLHHKQHHSLRDLYGPRDECFVLSLAQPLAAYHDFLAHSARA